MKNKLQLNYWSLGGFEGKAPVAEAMDEIVEMGLDGIELAFGAGELATDVTEAQCRAIRADDRRTAGLADLLAEDVRFYETQRARWG